MRKHLCGFKSMLQFNVPSQCVFARARTFAVAGEAAESFTCTTMLNSPGPVGMPLMTPVAPASVSPAGNCPEAIHQVYGGVPPWAARVAEYATPSTAPDSDVVATDKRVEDCDCVVDCVVDCALFEPGEQPQQAANSTRERINCFMLHLGLHEPGGAKQAMCLAENRCRMRGSRFAEQLSFLVEMLLRREWLEPVKDPTLYPRSIFFEGNNSFRINFSVFGLSR